jgi:ABC-2 type transport system ATP-binding protein
MLCGLLKPSSGRAVVNGFDIDREPEALRQNLGYMAQKYSLYPDLTVRENLEFYGGIYGVTAAKLAQRIDQVYSQLGMRHQSSQLTRALSMGWQKRVALGAAMLHEPPVLFLDEPTSGVDPASRRLIWEILDDLSATGTSIFVTTHAMDEADRCDRLAIMHRSCLIADGSPDELKQRLPGFLYKVDVPGDRLLDSLEIARRLPFVEEAALFGTALHMQTATDEPGRLRRDLEEAGVTVHDVQQVAPTLEDIFVSLTQRHPEPGGDAAGKTP